MEAQNPGNSLPTIQSKSTSERSIFDFSSVEDLRPTNDDQDSERVSFDKTQPAIPFDKSYIAHAPSRHLLKLNSRYTFFGGHGGSSKDIRGSVENLTGYTIKMKRSSNLGKLSKSSPDLRYASYQTSNSYDVTKQEPEEDFVTRLNMNTNLENEKECSKKESTKRGESNEHDNGNVGEIRSSTEAKLENQPKLTTTKQDSKWMTCHEQEYTKNHANTNWIRATLTRESTKLTANESEEKRAFLSSIDSQNDNVQLSTSRKENAAVDDLFSPDTTRASADKQTFRTRYRNLPTLQTTHCERNPDNNISINSNKNFSVLQMDGTFDFQQPPDDFHTSRPLPAVRSTSDITFDSQEIRGTVTAPSCSVSQITLKVLNDSTFCDKNQISQHKGRKIDTFSHFETGKDQDDPVTKLDDRMSSEVDMFLPYRNGSLCDNGVGFQEAKSQKQKAYEDSYNVATAVKVSGIRQSSVSVTQADRSSRKYPCQWLETKTGGEEKDRVQSKNNRKDILVDFGDETNEAMGLSNVKELEVQMQVKKGRAQGEKKDGEKEVETVEEHFVDENTTPERRDRSGDQQQPPKKEGEVLNCSDFEIKERNEKTQTKMHTKSQTTGKQKQLAPLTDDSVHTLSNSTVLTQEHNNNDTDNEKTKSVESQEETTDNSLIKNMMGMFCLLGLKDSPEGFYKNEGYYKGQTATKDISGLEYEHELDVEEAACQSSAVEADKPKVRKEIKKRLSNITEEEAFLKRNETGTLTNKDERNITNIDTAPVLGEYCDIVEEQQTQPGTLYENPPKEATVKDNISYFHAGSETARKGKSTSDKDSFLYPEPETTLRILYNENRRENKVDDGRNTEVNTDEESILQTTNVQDLLIDIKGDSEENLTKTSELDEFERQVEMIVEQENKAMVLSTNAVRFNTQDEELESVCEESRTTGTKSRSKQDTVITTNLNINRNKWSHSFILPPRKLNVPNSKKVSGTFNVLVLNSDLTLVSPERQPTIVTLNLFPCKTVRKSSRGYSNEISQARIVMNVETKTIVLNPIQTEKVVEYKMKDESVVPTLTEKTKKESLPDIQEKEGNEDINDFIMDREHFKNVSDHFPKLESDYRSQETKAEVEGINERSSKHLTCFEMDELVDEKIIKQECKRHESLPELDEILLPDTEIREIIGKEEIDTEYELLSPLDEPFNLEEVQENEAEFLASRPRNNEVLSLKFTTQNAEMIKKQQDMEEQYSIQSKDKVREICTKTVHDRCLQSDHLSQMDDMLEQEQVREFIPDKVEVQMDVQHDKQCHFLESDKYFDFIKTVQQPVTDEIDAKLTEQSFELPKQSAAVGILPPTVGKPNSETSELNFFQINEDQETVQIYSNNDGSYSREQNLTQGTFKIAVNEQEAQPAVESTSMLSNDNAFHNTNGDHPVFVISHLNYPSVTIPSYNDDCIRQRTVSPIADESSSIVSNYDASAESSSDTSQNCTQEESEEELTDEEEYVPWDITVSYSNPETMKSEFKVLRTTYSNIQPEVHKIKSGSTDGKVTIGGKGTSPHIKKHSKISEQIYTSVEVSTNPKISQCSENNLSSDIDATLNDETLMDNGDQYRTTMDIHRNQKQVSTSYVVLQRFGKQESPRTYFELNYDIDVWKVGNKIASRIEDDAKKTFVVSYATIEQVKFPQRAEVHLEKIDEEEICDEDIYNPFSSKQLTPTKVPLLSPSTPKPIELNNEFPSTKELTAFQIPSTSREVILAQSPPVSPWFRETSQMFKNYEQTRAASLKSSSPRPPLFLQSTMTATGVTMLEVQQNESDPYGIRKQTSPTEVLIPENIPLLPIPPQTSNTNATEVHHEENDNHLPQIPGPQNERNLGDICYPPVQPFPTLSPTTTPTKTVEGEESKPYLPLKERSLESISYPSPPPPTPQNIALPTTFTKETQQEKITRHLQEKDSPAQKSLNLNTKMLNQVSITIHSSIPPPVHTTPVWSFARSVFHTDGENKTFFKVIDGRNKCFQSSTFMYRGDRVRVSRGVNAFRSHFENRERDVFNEHTIHCRVDDDYEGYSEIWDDGNMIAEDNDVMLNVDGPVNRSKAFYELATEQNLYEQDYRNCSWYLKLYGSFGACELSPSNLDATAIEDDNTLLGSRGFVSGHHTWVIQGLGIFCAVGVCYPGEDVRRWYKGGKWVWTTDGLRYSESHGIRKSEFGQWRNEDVLEISLNCEEHKLTIGNTRTNVQATLDGFEGEVYPYFNIYKGSSIRLLETSSME